MIGIGAFGATLDGRVSDSSWSYAFAATRTPFLVHGWSVDGRGEVSFAPPAPPIQRRRPDYAEIAPYLGLDSPEIVRLALRYGGRRYVEARPDAFVWMSVFSRGDVLMWEVRFRVIAPICELGPIVIDPRDGTLLERDLSCLDRL